MFGAVIALVAGVAFAQPVITTFAADAPALASEVNANFAQVAAFTVPRGGIIFVDAAACPTGWTQVAQGRAIVGKPTGGTNGQSYGTALSNTIDPTHGHGLSTNGAHNHGGETGSHSGYIFGNVNWSVQVGFDSPWHHKHGIGSDGNHSHTVADSSASSVFPFVYYTACRKN